MPEKSMSERLEWDIGIVLRGITGHPSRRKGGFDETQAAILAGNIVQHLVRSGWIIGRREHGLSMWLDGGRALEAPPRFVSGADGRTA